MDEELPSSPTAHSALKGEFSVEFLGSIGKSVEKLLAGAVAVSEWRDQVPAFTTAACGRFASDCARIKQDIAKLSQKRPEFVASARRKAARGLKLLDAHLEVVSAEEEALTAAARACSAVTSNLSIHSCAWSSCACACVLVCVCVCVLGRFSFVRVFV